jgi:hypothetical protein
MTFFTFSSKRTFAILFTYISIGVISFFILAEMGNFVSPIRSELVKRFKESNIYNAEAITLGTSHNEAISAEDFSYPLFHLYTGGQSLKESLFFLEYFKTRVDKNKIKFILIPVTIGSIYQLSEVSHGIEEELIVLEPIDFLIYTIPYNLNFYLRGLLSKIARQDNWAGVARSLFFKNKEKNRTKEEAFKKEEPFKDDIAIIHINNDISINNNQKKINLKILTDISVVTQKLGACLILYESPVSYVYLNNFEKYKPSLKGWKTIFINFANQYNSCVYFIEDIWPLQNSKNPFYYRDQDHLNDRGSYLFTRLIDMKIHHIK